MSDMIPSAARGLLPSDGRRAGRAVSRLGGRNQVREAAVDCETEVTLVKSDSVTAVAGSMMNDVARVAQAQAQFELLVPQASARLNAIADAHALDEMSLAADHRRALRRL